MNISNKQDTQFIVRDAESKFFINKFDSKKEAERIVKKYKKQDKACGIHGSDLYEIVECASF